MKTIDIAIQRLINQKILNSGFNSSAEVVNYMCAMQAQDFPMCKWGVGIRGKNLTESDFNSSFDNGEILRTHLMRPTWHLVTAGDIGWMLELTAPQIKQKLKGRDVQLELTKAVYKKSNALLRKFLKDNEFITRDEAKMLFTAAGIEIDLNRAAHLLMEAELEGIICSGKIIDGKPSYALLEKRVPAIKSLKREEALALLARKYFTSHCPATLDDFIWWSGLKTADAKNALEMIGKDFTAEQIGGNIYLFPNSYRLPRAEKETIFLVPAYDEYLVGYRDRSAFLTDEQSRKVVSNNGIFWPVVVHNGSVIGRWKRETNKDKIVIGIELFAPESRKLKEKIEKAALHYGKFRGAEIIIK